MYVGVCVRVSSDNFKKRKEKKSRRSINRARGVWLKQNIDSLMQLLLSFLLLFIWLCIVGTTNATCSF